MRHKHADLIHAWADGAEIEIKLGSEWVAEKVPDWHGEWEYRIKPKEPEWWENIPKHGILVESVNGRHTAIMFYEPMDVTEWTPLTNEEIERFKR